MAISNGSKYLTEPSDIPVLTTMGQQVLSDALDDRITSVTTSYTITVGSAGDYPTINEAMFATKKLRKYFSDYTSYIEILLLSGFIMEEQVVVIADDYSKVMLSSEDAEVVINRASLLDISGVNNVPSGYGPAFTGIRGGHLPIINVLFNMDSTGTASGRNGIFLNENSSCVVRRTKGIKNAGERGVEVANSSFYGRETVWDGAGTRCIRISNGSIANVRDSSAQNGERGISVTSAYATAGSCNFSGNSEYGIEATRGGIVQASDSIISGCGLINVYVDEGGKVVANDCDISGGLYRGVDVSRGSEAVLTNSDISGCADRAISASQGCTVEASFTDCTDSGGSRAVAAFSGSRINLGSATAGSNIGGFAVYVNTGSIINASGVVGSCNVTANDVTENGIVFGISSS